MLEDYQDERFEWDVAKSVSNYTRHGLTFSEAIKIFDRHYLKTPILRPDLIEPRMLATGLMHDKEYSVIYTPRNGRIRIITARRARRYEREAFWESYDD